MQDDDRLMQRAQTGDARAFAELFDRYRRPIFNYLRRMGMNRTIAEDGTQDVFLKLWERRAQYRPEGAFSTYLYRIAHNYRVNQLRRGPVDGGRFLDGREGASSDPADLAEQSDLVDRMRQALDTLPEHLKEAFVLKRLQEMPYAEVARVTGCTAREAETQVTQAFEKLAKVMKPGRAS